MKQLIRRLQRNGYNSGEAATKVRLRRHRVRKIARRSGFPFQGGLGDNARLFSVPVPKRCLLPLREAAQITSIEESEILSRVAIAVLEDNARLLNRLLPYLTHRPRRDSRRAEL